MSFRQVAISGAKWTSVSAAAASLLQLVQLVVLARLLTPADFGLMGMVLVVVGFANSYADMGVSQALIFRQDTTPEEQSSLYWLNVMAGVGLYLLIVLLTPLITGFFAQPSLEPLILLTSLVFLITPFGQQFQILLQKELIFDRLAQVEIIATVAGTVVAIGGALLGFGVLSLVAGELANATVRAAVLIAIGWRRWKPALTFSPAHLRGYLSFGMYQMGERSLNYFNKNIDKILIGRLLGPELLGFYTLAFNLIIYPISIINPIITRVSYPIFAKLQNEIAMLRQGYMEVMQILALINFPLFFGFAVTAPVVIPTFFGPQWMPSVLIAQILAGVGLIRSTGNPVGSLLYAKGYARLGFVWNLIEMVTQVPGVVLGAYFGGMVGVAVACLLLQILYFALSYWLLIRQVVGPCSREYLQSMGAACVMSTVMALGVWIVGMILPDGALLLSAGLEILTGVLIYGVLILLFQRKVVDEIWRGIRGQQI
jgi:O-antigen/teichoic acid export membrane protein